MQSKVHQIISQSISVKQALLENPLILTSIVNITEAMIVAFKKDHKVLFCGNGGSASDAQHIAAELSGRFYKDRPALFAESLTVNTSYLTAVANDYGYDEIFSRLTQGMGRKGDLLIALSTSGNSPNVVRAVETAKEIGMITVGLTGENGGKMKDLCDHIVLVPSKTTPRIQESHILIGHILCELVEAALFPEA